MTTAGSLRRIIEEESTINEREQIEHELIKNALKISVMNNQARTDFQKQQAIYNIDQADWLVKMLKQCGYIV